MSLSYLVDTDWVIHYLNGNRDIVNAIRRYGPDGLALSVISLAELCEGVYYSRDPDTNEQVLRNFLGGVELIGIDEEVARLFGRERGRLRAAKLRVGDFDLLIAVTAVRHDLTLLTNNRRHFSLIHGVRLIPA